MLTPGHRVSLRNLITLRSISTGLTRQHLAGRTSCWNLLRWGHCLWWEGPGRSPEIKNHGQPFTGEPTCKKICPNPANYAGTFSLRERRIEAAYGFPRACLSPQSRALWFSLSLLMFGRFWAPHWSLLFKSDIRDKAARTLLAGPRCCSGTHKLKWAKAGTSRGMEVCNGNRAAGYEQNSWPA